MELKDYLETVILPRYKNQDLGHNKTHIQEVLKYSLQLIEFFPELNPNIVMTAVYYHDLGNLIDRDSHHIISANIVLADKRLLEWFTEKEILTISGACRNHRDSNKNKENMTLLEKVINDADGCDGVKIDRMLERAFLYNYHKYQNLKSLPEIYDEIFNHLGSKYSTNGYAKSFILDETEKITKTQLTQRNNLFKNKKEFIRRLTIVTDKLPNCK